MKVVCFLIAFACVLIARSQNSTVYFIDVTERSGIDFRYTFGDDTYENILESSGSGVSILDYNNDGFMDLYLLNGRYLERISDPEGKKYIGAYNHLYKNNGDGTFLEVAKQAGIDDLHWSMCAGTVDFEGDGDTDIFLMNYGPNVIYFNNGNGTFSDVTEKLNLKGPDRLNGFTKWSVSIAFWDYDLDSDLDLMVGNFLAFDPFYKSPTAPEMMPHPTEYRGQASYFYRQEEAGKFIVNTKTLGLYYPDSKCMGLTVFDFDDDGDLDLFQGNDHQDNFLFKNDGLGRFTESAIASGVAVNDRGQPTGSMHGSIGDIDGDGLIDLLVTDLKYGALYKNMGEGMFEDITEQSGVAFEFDGKGQWAAFLFDYDNDGDLDIFSTNGTAEELIDQYPLLLENNGKGQFTNVGKNRGKYFLGKYSGRGAATWDFDNDGDLDIIVSHINPGSKATLLRNDGGNTNNWLGLKLVGITVGSAIGAKVIIEAGSLKQVKVNQWGTSYLSYSDPRIHIGLGNENKIDKLEIRWSDGEVEVLQDIEVNQYLLIRQGEGILK